MNYELTIPGYVVLKVYDMLGNEVAELVNEYRIAGEYKIAFDAKGLTGGEYFIRYNIDGKLVTKKILLIK